MAALTSLVSRHGEVTALTARLAETRLLALIGTSRIGKSPLALEVRRQAKSASYFQRQVGVMRRV